MRLKYIGSVLIPAVLASLVSLGLNKFTQIQSFNWNLSLLFFTVLGFSLNLIYLLRSKSEDFTQLLIVAIVVKLLVALTALVIYSFYHKVDFLYFSLQFIFHFILFTIFEIRYLLFLIQKK